MNKIRKAVSIILKYNDEIYLIKRQNYLKAFPGYSAFPGGKVDKADEGNSIEETVFNAARREILEELEFDLKGSQVQSLQEIAKATSPDFNPRRFETTFFLVELKEKVLFNFTQDEFSEAKWLTPKSIVEDYNKGKRLFVKPILEMVKRLADHNFDFYNFDQRRIITDEVPSIEPLKNFHQLMPLSNTIFPATRTNCFVIGDERHLIIDPSPKNADEYLALKKSLKKFNPFQVLITHRHQDHYQYSNRLAKELNLPMVMTPFTQENIERIDSSYFDDIHVSHCFDGDVVGRWLDQDILIHEVPGHDKGQVALAPESLSWFIAGDLFQGMGTVVIGGEGSSMKEYMMSLEKVIRLNPMCVIPSHGIALGGVNILEKTLEHRKIRESQVLELINANKSKQEILETLYFNIPKEIHKYAMANIESHLDKLVEDGLIVLNV